MNDDFDYALVIRSFLGAYYGLDSRRFSMIFQLFAPNTVGTISETRMFGKQHGNWHWQDYTTDLSGLVGYDENSQGALSVILGAYLGTDCVIYTGLETPTCL